MSWTNFVRNRLEMWQLWQAADALHARPSSLLAVKNAYAAYCLDVAVVEFGKTIQGELEEILASDKKNAQAMALNHLRRRLGLQPKFRAPPKSATNGAG